MTTVSATITARVPANSTLSVTLSEDNSPNEDTVTVSDGQAEYTFTGFSGAGSSYSVYYEATGPEAESVDVYSVELSSGVEIAGTVVNSGSPVQGAKIYAIDTTNGDIEATATTDSSGNYSVTVAAGLVLDVVAQWDDGTDKYNAEANTFIET